MPVAKKKPITIIVLLTAAQMMSHLWNSFLLPRALSRITETIAASITPTISMIASIPILSKIIILFLSGYSVIVTSWPIVGSQATFCFTAASIPSITICCCAKASSSAVTSYVFVYSTIALPICPTRLLKSDIV